MSANANLVENSLEEKTEAARYSEVFGTFSCLPEDGVSYPIRP